MQGGISIDCERVHRTLKRIVKARASLDAQEAAALREGKRLRVWRELGYASMVQYMEAELGYTARVAMERLRVANAIEDLPVIADLLDKGELSLSAAEELTRVATPETEGDWLAACHDKPVREIEAMVAEHNKGERPTDPPDPSLRRYSLHYKVRAENYALERQVKQLLEKELGARLDDDAFIGTVFRRILDGAAAERTRAPYQISVTTCDTCKKGWQDGGGVTVEMTPAAVARAECDAERIGRVDSPTPQRAHQDVPPKVRRQVGARDHHRCAVPGCTCHTNLDIHHIIPRALGGTNDPSNLLTLCESHHLAHHDGYLLITGAYPSIDIKRAWWKTPRGYIRPPLGQGSGVS
jgi:hypothetical protein